MSTTWNNLPVEVMGRIFSYLSLDENAKLRAVSHEFDAVAQQRLNDGFKRLLDYQFTIEKRLERAKRRFKPPPRNVIYPCNSILNGTSLMLLPLSDYSEHIKEGYCCFVPGKVLDELFKILRAAEAAIETNESVADELDKMDAIRELIILVEQHFKEFMLPEIKYQKAKKLEPKKHEKLERKQDISFLPPLAQRAKRIDNLEKEVERQNKRIKELEEKLEKIEQQISAKTVIVESEMSNGVNVDVANSKPIKTVADIPSLGDIKQE